MLVSVCGDEAITTEKEAADAFRRHTTNLQLNRDGTVRLIRLSKPTVTDETLAELPRFSNLDYLAVVAPAVTDAGLDPIGFLKNLDTLFLCECALTGDGLSVIRNLPKLQRLGLSQTKINDDAMKHVAAAESLILLWLDHTAVGDHGVKHLCAHKHLEQLMLDHSQVTDAGLEHLASIKNLKGLSLTGCRLSGDSLSSLKSLTELTFLGLSATQVTDETICQLVQLPSLTAVELYDTTVSDEAIASLQQAMPKLRIGHHRGRKYAPRQKTAKANDRPAIASATSPPITDRLRDSETPDFQRHVIPLLGRLGCNGRSCHGSFQGQGGFRLSMFGYDFEMDHQNLSERIDVDAAAASLLVNKPTSEEDHEGGQRFTAGSWQQTLLRKWIEGGGHGVSDSAATFVELRVTPAEILFDAAGQSRQLRAVAVWSDGSQEDVTCLTRFETNDDTIATVSEDGLIQSHGSGDTHVVSYYDNGIVATPVMTPVSDRSGDRFPELKTPTKVDELVISKLRKLGILPSKLCSDTEFLRRISLDLIGTLPSPGDVQQFLGDPSPDKRLRKIDELLESPAYIAWWTTRLCDLTGSNAGYLGGTEMAQPVAAQWRAWIERRVRENVGWDEIVAGIVTSSSRRPGASYRDFVQEQSGYTRRDEPADYAAIGNPMSHFWYRDNISVSSDKTLAFGYTFMGLRLDCAQCHKHPFDRWSQRDFELFTEFFTRIKTGIPPHAQPVHDQMREMLGVPVKLNTAALRRQSYLRIASEGRSIPWREVYIEPAGGKPQLAKLLGADVIDLSEIDDPRQPLMQWLRTEPNRYLAKAFVNRIWANYFNVGIHDPTDDLNLANPPSNDALIAYLTESFVESGYDMKWLHRTITRSDTYQRSWRPNETNIADERNFSHAILRRLTAEVAIDAIIRATANDKTAAAFYSDVANRKISQHPKSYQTRSIDYSLLVFGKPLRTTNCDCERQNVPTLPQALFIRNDQELIDLLRRPDGWLAQIQKETLDESKVDDLVRQAYLRTLSRPPTETEASDCREHLLSGESISSASLAEGMHDLLWALLNTQEFIVNR